MVVYNIYSYRIRALRLQLADPGVFERVNGGLGTLLTVVGLFLARRTDLFADFFHLNVVAAGLDCGVVLAGLEARIDAFLDVLESPGVLLPDPLGRLFLLVLGRILCDFSKTAATLGSGVGVFFHGGHVAAGSVGGFVDDSIRIGAV